MLTEATDAGHEFMDGVVQRQFMVKILPKIGPGAETHGRFLNRIIRWEQRGYEYEADPKHVEDLLEYFGMTNAKPADTPCIRDAAPMRNSTDRLALQDTKSFQFGAGKSLYLVIDRLESQFAVNEVMVWMADPKEFSMAMLKRFLRYLVKEPRVSFKYPYQDTPKKGSIYGDANWAGCKETRRSSGCVIETVGIHTIDGAVSRQQVTALSSGESEFYGAGSAAARGIETGNIYRECGIDLEVEVLSDSSAARGMVARTGVGRTRHIETRWPWLQEQVRKKTLKLNPVDTMHNLADIGTKAHDRARFEQLLSLMNYGRPWSDAGVKYLLAAAILLQQWEAAEGSPALVEVNVETGLTETARVMMQWILLDPVRISGSLMVVIITIILGVMWSALGRRIQSETRDAESYTEITVVERDELVVVPPESSTTGSLDREREMRDKISEEWSRLAERRRKVRIDEEDLRRAQEAHIMSVTEVEQQRIRNHQMTAALIQNNATPVLPTNAMSRVRSYEQLTVKELQKLAGEQNFNIPGQRLKADIIKLIRQQEANRGLMSGTGVGPTYAQAKYALDLCAQIRENAPLQAWESRQQCSAWIGYAEGKKSRMT